MHKPVLSAGRSIYNGLNLSMKISFFIERVENRSGFGRTLVLLDQFKTFDRVDHRYLVSFLKAVSFGIVFRG